MAYYRVHRIKEGPGEQFRWAAHVGGTAIVKWKDYEAGPELEAATPYAAWKILGDRHQSLRPGDLLEAVTDEGQSGELRIAKYIGFEPAQWFIPEVKEAKPVEQSHEAVPANSEMHA